MSQSLLTIIKVLVITKYSNSTICAFVQDTDYLQMFYPDANDRVVC